MSQRRRRGEFRRLRQPRIIEPGMLTIPITARFEWSWREEFQHVAGGVAMAVVAGLLGWFFALEQGFTVLDTLTTMQWKAILTAWPLLVYTAFSFITVASGVESTPEFALKKNGLITMGSAPGEEILFRFGLTMLLVMVLRLVGKYLPLEELVAPVGNTIAPVFQYLGFRVTSGDWSLTLGSIISSCIFGYMHRGYDAQGRALSLVVVERSIVGAFYAEIFFGAGLLPAITVHVVSNALVWLENALAARNLRRIELPDSRRK